MNFTLLLSTKVLRSAVKAKYKSMHKFASRVGVSLKSKLMSLLSSIYEVFEPLNILYKDTFFCKTQFFFIFIFAIIYCIISTIKIFTIIIAYLINLLKLCYIFTI
jgi:hypothetical protein